MEDQEIVDKANRLAREIYQEMGYLVPEGHRFDQATHPQELQCWNIADIAFDLLLHTDINDALNCIESEADDA